MKSKIRKVLNKYEHIICSVLMFIGILTLNQCGKNWYQPKEPEGFLEFIRKRWKCEKLIWNWR